MLTLLKRDHARNLTVRWHAIADLCLTAGVSEAAQLPDGDPLNQFQPPEEDVAFIDARALAVPGTTEDDETATRRRDDVAAFARPVRNAERLASAIFAPLTASQPFKSIQTFPA